MILITGASGMVGGPTIKALQAEGHRLRVLTSSEASARKLQAAGVHETVIGDFRSTGDVERALAGTHTVVHIPPAFAEDEDQIGIRVVQAAGRAKLDHIVYISCYHSHPIEIWSHYNKLKVEDECYRSEIGWTILQPSMFMQNLFIPYIWARIEKEGVLAWPWRADQKLASIDTVDIAAAVAAVIADSRFRGGTFELSSEALTNAEMAQICSEISGRDIRAERVEHDVFSSMLRTYGASEWSAGNALTMARSFDSWGYRGGNSVAFEAIVGRKPATYREFAERELRALVPA